ncbi:cysteine sulfinic acid decarboxylase-like [Planococcus citri]|uniref:cysteine sulfinic acid decarboxylase-like n=1 Tax=Planococcus citri TaxID=170843 RepID=UPI0031FA042D
MAQDKDGFTPEDIFVTEITHRHLEIMIQVIEMSIRKVAIEGTDRKEPVLRYRNPDHLKQLFSFDIEKKPFEGDILRLIEDLITYCTKTGHPRYFYQFSAGLDMHGLLGSWLMDILNVNTFTYEGAPLFTLMEKFVINEITSLFGYPETSGGIFCPGGSLANGFAINLARYLKFPDVKSDGMNIGAHLIVFISEDAHYSIHKMAALLGIGERNVIAVKTDDFGRMDTAHLLQLIENYSQRPNYHPFMVIGTAGTTVLGTFDPIEEIAAICSKYKLWFHVDAAWGGAAIFSDKYKHHLKGIEKTDSFVWNPSKTLAVPQQCSLLCVRNGLLMKSAHSFGASYLFHDKFYGSGHDLGDTYIQCGRKPDVFKLWMLWKMKGYEGVKYHVNCLLERAEYLTNRIKENENFKLVCEPSYINICFWYIPEAQRGQNIGDIYQEIDKVAPRVGEIMLRNGSAMINWQPLRRFPNFFRFVCCSSAINDSDCDYLLSEIQRIAQDL